MEGGERDLVGKKREKEEKIERKRERKKDEWVT